MQGGFLLDVVVAECTAVFQLLASEDETLLIWWDTFFVLDLRLHIVDGVTGFNLQGDRLPCQGFDKDLHASTESQDKMEGGFLLDVVVAQSTTIFQLFPSEDETLLIWWNTFFVLDLRLHIVDGVTGFNLQGDRLPCQGFDEDLHAPTESQDKMEGRFLLDVVVAQCTAVFQLFASEDETLLIWWDTFFVLDLRFHII